jgi:hypothetical protein
MTEEPISIEICALQTKPRILMLVTGLWIKLRFSPTTFPKAEKNSLKGQKGPLSSNSQPVSSPWKAFGKVQTRFVQSPIVRITSILHTKPP